MAILLQQIMPENITMEMLDESMAQLGVHQNPPAGLVVHAYYTQKGRAHVIDVWETAEAYEKFLQERLEPASLEFVGRHGLPPDTPLPEKTITEIHGIVYGKIPS